MVVQRGMCPFTCRVRRCFSSRIAYGDAITFLRRRAFVQHEDALEDFATIPPLVRGDGDVRQRHTSERSVGPSDDGDRFRIGRDSGERFGRFRRHGRTRSWSPDRFHEKIRRSGSLCLCRRSAGHLQSPHQRDRLFADARRDGGRRRRRDGRRPDAAGSVGHGESSLRVIGSTNTTVNAASKLAASSTIQFNLDPQDLALQGFTKAADALGQVPGVNISGSPHSVGDDTSIDIRGLGQGEVRPLLDGHPIGPIGVFSPDYYNYANSPYALLQNIQVTVGSGSTGLYGVDVIGGTIDFQTLELTRRRTRSCARSGRKGRSEPSSSRPAPSVISAMPSATPSKECIGNIAPQAIFQGARPNNNENLQNGGACLPAGGIPDVTSCNTALNTYTVSQDFKELNDLAKLRYNFTPTTALTLTAYDGEHHSDSTGNGDDDYVPYATQLAAIQSNPSNCGTNGYLAVTNGHPNGQCLSAQQLAQSDLRPRWWRSEPARHVAARLQRYVDDADRR